MDPASYASFSQTKERIDLLTHVLLNQSTNEDFGDRQKALIASYLCKYDDLQQLLANLSMKAEPREK